jgi:nitroreductase
MLNLGLDELLTTTRSVRKRLDLDRPVDRSLITDCLEVAFQAPNGSNRQQWDWVIVDDPSLRVQMANIYRGAMDDLQGDPARITKGIDYSSGPQQRISSSVQYLYDHLHEVPALLVPTIRGRLDDAPIFVQASIWGSILPAVWNFMLALRVRGLGSAWTTVHLYREREMAELLGIPSDRVTQAGMFPIGWTIGTEFKPAVRAAAGDATHWNRW